MVKHEIRIAKSHVNFRNNGYIEISILIIFTLS